MIKDNQSRSLFTAAVYSFLPAISMISFLFLPPDYLVSEYNNYT